jgi:hypothetical protein
MKKANVSDRRSILKAAGAGLVAAAVPSMTTTATGADRATAGEDASGEGEKPSHHPKPVYLYGCGWNRDLPGVFGEVCLTFEMRAELNGTGVGTFGDDVHPEINSQFQINSATRHGHTYTFEGEIISSRDPSLVGMDVRIVAEKKGNGIGSASITVGSNSQELVVIAIIAILIGLLLPAVQ